MSSFNSDVSTRLAVFWLKLALVGQAAMAVLAAQDRLSPTTLGSWNASGAAPLVALDQGAILLPAGGQLARAYPAGLLRVHLISRPFFGSTEDKTPALEVGPASLAFVRIENGGGMVLLGDRALPLPSAISLDADSCSLRPLDLSLTFDRSRDEATLVLDGASYTVSATTGAPQLQVAVSAGSGAGWTLNLLEVSSTPDVASGGAAAADPAGAKAERVVNPLPAGLALAPKRVVARQRAFESAVALAAAGDLAGAEKALAASAHDPANTAGWELEQANRLVQLAMRLREQGSLDRSAKAARLVLQHVDRCVKLATDAEADVAGSALELGGLVNDRFFGDLKSAEAAYRQSLTIVPGQASARSALDRLLDARDHEQKKLKAWSRK